MVIADEVPNISAMFPKVFVKEEPEELLSLCNVMHRITLKGPSNLAKTFIFKALQAFKLMPKFKEWINKQMCTGILKRTRPRRHKHGYSGQI